ncbi:MAG: sugar ABC transporter ATP-binding protein, partial [Spirochaetes bacterium]|nr:sugar ABC transporter ATP-binding protein [Spirochaetota bacterium]
MSDQKSAVNGRTAGGRGKNTPLVRMVDIHKWFGKVNALRNINFHVDHAEIVGLVGDNGAGKSTVIKMISGVYPPTKGQIYFQGREIKIQNPMDALNMGIETIYQDLALAENLNVYSNIFLGREKLKKSFGLFNILDHDYMLAESKTVLKGLDIEIPSLKNKIAMLSGGQRQAVAISRSIYWDAKLLIMDEPTAALGVAEQQKVLDLVRTLKTQNVPVIIISHQMHDVFSVADRLVVMRRGKKVGERIVKETNPDE